MAHSEMPSIGICFPWWSGGSGRGGKGCSSWIIFYYILLVDLVNVENRFRDIISLNLKIDVVLVISCLPELSIGYDVGVEVGDVGYVSKLEELLACRCINININTAIAFYI